MPEKLKRMLCLQRSTLEGRPVAKGSVVELPEALAAAWEAEGIARELAEGEPVPELAEERAAAAEAEGEPAERAEGVKKRGRGR